MEGIILKEYPLLTQDEHKKLLEIRNSDEVRKASINEDVIAIEEHLSWVEKLKDDKTKHYFAVIYNDALIGGVNCFGKPLKWGVFFSRDALLIVKSIVPIYFMEYLFERFGCKSIFAEVKKDNKNALLYNKNLGFKEVVDGELVLMELDMKSFTDAKSSRVLRGIVKKMDKFEMEIEDARKN